MNNKQISEISAKTNLSQATVSKVLNHCYGVSGDVRERVFKECGHIKGVDSVKNHISIYVILPETPNFFWGNKLPSLDNIKIKYNIYSRLGDNDTVIRYLTQATELDSEVIIVAASLNKETEEILTQLSKKKFIIFLTEYNQAFNTFYVGSNPKTDGGQLALSCLKHHNLNEKVLLIRDILPSDCHSKTSAMRLEGFLEKLPNKNFDIIDIEMQTGIPYFSSTLARELSALLKKNQYHSVVCFNGFTDVLCSALQKIKLPFKVNCYGFENSPQNKKFAELGFLKAVVCQNFSNQLSCALELSKSYLESGCYPESKYTHIQSKTIDFSIEN